jgi:tripeptidyl-peptidase-1
MGEAEPSSLIQLTFAIKNRNLDLLAALTLRAADPLSAEYGQWLSMHNVATLTAPEPEHIAVVMSFLGGRATLLAGSPNSDLLQATMTMRDAAALMGSPFHVFRHAASNRTTVRLLQDPVLPANVSAAVDFISPTTWAKSMPPMRTKHRKSAEKVSKPQNEMFNPAVLRKYYHVGAVEGNASNNKQAVTGFLDQFYLNENLQEFFREKYPPAVGRTMATVGDGGIGNAGVEASLDTEYIMSMGGGVKSEFWSFSGSAPGNPNAEPWLKFLTALSSTESPPLVISMSYSEPEHDIPADYENRRVPPHAHGIINRGDCE